MQPWSEQLLALAKVAVLSCLPVVELSGAIPYGLLATDAPPALVIATAIVANALIAPAVYFLFPAVVKLLCRWGWFDRLWQRYTERVLKRIHAAVEKYGWWGITLAIALPGPGSGVYTASLGSFLLGLSFPRFMLATVIGIPIAGAIVSIAVLSGSEALRWMFDTKLVD